VFVIIAPFFKASINKASINRKVPIKVLRKILLITALYVVALKVAAVVEVHQFDNDVQRERYHSFVDELRCPKCQNQNLAGSDSPIASDLRRELIRLLEDGRSDKEIIDFMVNRYGDYVLYKPRLQRNTWGLWFGPLVLLGLGGMVLVLILLRRRGKSAMAEGQLSGGEQGKLNRLLGGDQAPSDLPGNDKGKARES